MRHLPLCLILPVLALAGCNAGRDDGPAAAAADAQNAAEAAGTAAASPVVAPIVPDSGTVAATLAQSDVRTDAPAQAALQPAANRGLTEILTLEVAHDYFADGRCSVCQIVPSAETVRLLQRTGAAIRTEHGRLSVVAASADTLAAGDRLEFELRSSDPRFAAYTAGDPVVDGQRADVLLAPGPSPGVWVVNITPGGDAPQPATIRYASRQAHWRWIVLPGGQAESLAGWTIRRESAPDTPVDYDPPEATDLQDGRLAWQITLRAPLPLRERPPADQTFMLVPPPGAGSGPIRLPSATPDGLRASDEPGRPTIAEIFVFL